MEGTVWFPIKNKNVCLLVCSMVFNATFNNITVISWRSVLLVEETGGSGENHRHVASHWQTLSHTVVHHAWFELTTSVVICTDYIGSCKSNYHTIMAPMAPILNMFGRQTKNVLNLIIQRPTSNYFIANCVLSL